MVEQSTHRRASALLEQYQDIVIGDTTYSNGLRECEARYGIIKNFLAKFDRPFSVFELGANLGYFSLKIARDFEAVCFCVEGAYSEWLHAVLMENNNKAIYGLQATMSLGDLQALAQVEHFDVVLALSVVHHIDAPLGDIIATLRDLADYVIIELPTETNACGGARLLEAMNYDMSSFKKLGEGQSHLGGDPRPIFVIDGRSAALSRPYLGASRELDGVTLSSDISDAIFTKKGVSRKFIPGMNAHTFFYYGGFYPKITADLSAMEDLGIAEPHGDLTWWNVILSQSGPIAIDGAREGEYHGFDDNLQFALIRSIAKMSEYKNLRRGFYKFDKSNGVELLSSGWHVLEDWGVWSCEKVSRLFVPGFLTSQDVEMTIRTASACESVWINAIQVWEDKDADADSAALLEIKVPASVWNKSVPVLVDLGCKELRSPSRSGESEDTRVLGIALIDITVGPR